MYKNTPMQPEETVCVEHISEPIFSHRCVFTSAVNTSVVGVFMKSHRCKKKKEKQDLFQSFDVSL